MLESQVRLWVGGVFRCMSGKLDYRKGLCWENFDNKMNCFAYKINTILVMLNADPNKPRTYNLPASF